MTAWIALAATAMALTGLAAFARAQHPVPVRQQQDAVVGGGYGGYGGSQQQQQWQQQQEQYRRHQRQQLREYRQQRQEQREQQQSAVGGSSGSSYGSSGVSLADCMIRGGKLNPATDECEGGFGGG